MSITSFPINTVPPTANLITNTPSGPITATDVQAAINQLATLIPAPGSGTDPLFLIQGFNLSVAQPSANLSGANSTNRYGAVMQVYTDSRNIDPVFSNQQTLGIYMYGLHGLGNWGGPAFTNSKESFFSLVTSATYNASGQKFVHWLQNLAYGMGDSSLYAEFCQFSGGPIPGDEGQGFNVIGKLTQQGYLNVTTITSVPTQSVINTTLTQAVTRSKDPQTVTVVSTAGAVNGDWVVIGQMAPEPGNDMEAVQVISFTSTSITGIFRSNHLNGDTVTPALVLSCVSTYQMGQDRILVNLSQPSYSAGNVTAISGGGVTGTGTVWTNNMVGGNATNIGAISLDADTYTGAPFNGLSGDTNGPLRSWYQINPVTSNTFLGILAFSVAGDRAYRGKGPPPTGSGPAGNYPYIIRPCARVLKIGTDPTGTVVTGQLICETSTSTWAVGNVVEQVICPYTDVTGWQYQIGSYTNGGTYRGFMYITNSGARTFSSCIYIQDGGGNINQPTADGIAWDTVFNVQTKCNIGLYISQAQQAAIRLTSFFATGAPDASGQIDWGNPNSARIAPNSTNGALEIHPMLAQSNQGSIIWFASLTFPGLDPSLVLTRIIGTMIHLPRYPFGGASASSIVIDNTIDATTNYERGYWRWNNISGGQMEFGTEKGGTGSVPAWRLKTDTVTEFAFDSTQPVQFANPADFAANGSVATALSSVGPTGASTTVQKWLKIRDDTGANRYIPCF